MLLLLVGVTAFACPRVTGFVIDDPVAGAKVEVTSLAPDGTLEGSVGSTTTNENGFFWQRVPGRRVYGIEATGGRFTDVATGCEIDLAGRDGLLGTVAEGPGRFAVTPISSLAAELALRDMSRGVAASEAISAAAEDVAEIFSMGDIRFDPNRTIPADQDSRLFAGNLTPRKLYGAVLAGLSQCAADRDAQAQGFPACTITPVELTDALVRDIRDGAIDGVDGSVAPPQAVVVLPTDVPLLDPGTRFDEVLADCIDRVRAKLPPGS
jgi:hypothetical protein